MPQLWHKLAVRAGGRRRVERFTKRPTYEFQLQAFCDAVLRGAPTRTPPSDAVANMRVIDAIYRAAGMQPRQPCRKRAHRPAVQKMRLAEAVRQATHRVR